MSAENKKLVWIAVAVSIFVLACAAFGIAFFTPKKGAALAPATTGNIAPPKASDPQDYLSLPPQSMPLGTAPNKDGDVIVIYGDKPTSLDTTLPGTGAEGAADLQAAATAAAGQEQAASQGGTALPGATTPATKPATTTTAPKASAAKPAAKPAATTATKTVAAKPVAKPVDQYWVQVASFSSRGKADELKDNLAKAGMASIITVKDISGKSWYRVRIGPWTSDAEAKGWLTRIKALPGCADAVTMKDAAAKK